MTYQTKYSISLNWKGDKLRRIGKAYHLSIVVDPLFKRLNNLFPILMLSGCPPPWEKGGWSKRIGYYNLYG